MSIEKYEFAGHPSLRILNREHTPSWRTYGSVYADFKAVAYARDPQHDRSGWLDITLTEHANAGLAGTKEFTTSTSMVLSYEDALALRDHLNAVFPVEEG